jgi:hypothetical protein
MCQAGGRQGRPPFSPSRTNVSANRIQMKDKKRNNSPRARRMPGPLAIVLLVVLAAGGFWWSKHREADAVPAANPSTTTQTMNAPSSSEALPAFEKLKGRWLRAEGSYIVEVRSVEPGGKMDAAYFNPRPINVAKAEAMKDGGDLKVFVELRDVNYPGSTYTLTYQPATDRLAGTYFHAVSGQNMDVEFSRLGEP